MKLTPVDIESIAIAERLSAQAIRKSQRLARDHAKSLRRLAASPGTVITVGDSWYDFFFNDLGDCLYSLGFDVKQVAQEGTSLDDLVHTSSQLGTLSQLIEQAGKADSPPMAILLSGGGDDVVKEKLLPLLNQAGNGLPTLNDAAVTQAVDVQMRANLVTVLAAITQLCDKFLGMRPPIVIDSYDYPVPDGRGIVGTYGAWLGPYFDKKGYPISQLDVRKQAMVDLIDRLTKMQQAVAKLTGFEHMLQLKLTGTLSTAAGSYQQDWQNELHPSASGFMTLAEKISLALGVPIL
jgi:hypothetical protein